MDLKSTILGYDRPVPRYTSYPAAPVFQPHFPAADVMAWGESLPPGSNLSLYLHIPFCPKLCHYCGCFTHITGRYAPVEDYVHLLKREIAQTGARLDKKHPEKKHIVRHIHFGGGSPTMLAPQDFTLLMSALREAFVIDEAAEIAVEVDPRHMNPVLAQTYEACGVNRISLGVQDFDDRVMESVNRVQPFEVVYKAVEQLRDHGITDFNLDFIYGLPHQTVRSLTRSMDYALLLKPNRFALYGYAHVPWKKKNMRLIPDDALPGNAARYDLFVAAAELLEGASYHPVGIDHFVKTADDMFAAQLDGTLRRNFQGYTNVAPDALIGLGLSAISQYPQGYAQNTTVHHEYQDHILNRSAPPIAKGYRLNGQDMARKAIIDDLMCNLCADLDQIWHAHGHAQADLDALKSLLTPYLNDGLASLSSGGVLKIPPRARPLVRVIASSFDQYLPPLDPAQPKHSMAV